MPKVIVLSNDENNAEMVSSGASETSGASSVNNSENVPATIVLPGDKNLDNKQLTQSKPKSKTKPKTKPTPKPQQPQQILNPDNVSLFDSFNESKAKAAKTLGLRKSALSQTQFGRELINKAAISDMRSKGVWEDDITALTQNGIVNEIRRGETVGQSKKRARLKNQGGKTIAQTIDDVNRFRVITNAETQKELASTGISASTPYESDRIDPVYQSFDEWLNQEMNSGSYEFRTNYSNYLKPSEAPDFYSGLALSWKRGMVQGAAGLDDLLAGAANLFNTVMSGVSMDESGEVTVLKENMLTPVGDFFRKRAEAFRGLLKQSEAEMGDQAQAPIQKLVEGTPGMIKDFAVLGKLSKVFGSVPIAFGAKAAIEASGRGVMDAKELGKEFVIGAAKGKLFHGANKVEGGIERLMAQAGSGALGSLGEDIARNVIPKMEYQKLAQGDVQGFMNDLGRETLQGVNIAKALDEGLLNVGFDLLGGITPYTTNKDSNRQPLISSETAKEFLTKLVPPKYTQIKEGFRTAVDTSKSFIVPDEFFIGAKSWNDLGKLYNDVSGDGVNAANAANVDKITQQRIRFEQVASNARVGVVHPVGTETQMIVLNPEAKNILTGAAKALGMASEDQMGWEGLNVPSQALGLYTAKLRNVLAEFPQMDGGSIHTVLDMLDTIAAGVGEMDSVVLLAPNRKDFDDFVSSPEFETRLDGIIAHEQTHTGQRRLMKIPGELGEAATEFMMNPNAMAEHPLHKMVVRGLKGRGVTEKFTSVESVAYLIGGAGRDWGMTPLEVGTYVNDYFDALANIVGEDALRESIVTGRFGTLAGDKRGMKLKDWQVDAIGRGYVLRSLAEAEMRDKGKLDNMDSFASLPDLNNQEKQEKANLVSGIWEWLKKVWAKSEVTQDQKNNEDNKANDSSDVAQQKADLNVDTAIKREPVNKIKAQLDLVEKEYRLYRGRINNKIIDLRVQRGVLKDRTQARDEAGVKTAHAKIELLKEEIKDLHKERKAVGRVRGELINDLAHIKATESAQNSQEAKLKALDYLMKIFGEAKPSPDLPEYVDIMEEQRMNAAVKVGVADMIAKGVKIVPTNQIPLIDQIQAHMLMGGMSVDTLDAAMNIEGKSLVDWFKDTRDAVRISAQRLNTMSQMVKWLKTYHRDNPDVIEALNIVGSDLNDIRGIAKRRNNLDRLLQISLMSLITAPSVAAGNITSGLWGTGLISFGHVVESLVHKIRTPYETQIDETTGEEVKQYLSGKELGDALLPWVNLMQQTAASFERTKKLTKLEDYKTGVEFLDTLLDIHPQQKNELMSSLGMGGEHTLDGQRKLVELYKAQVNAMPNGKRKTRLREELKTVEKQIGYDESRLSKFLIRWENVVDKMLFFNKEQERVFRGSIAASEVLIKAKQHGIDIKTIGPSDTASLGRIPDNVLAESVQTALWATFGKKAKEYSPIARERAEAKFHAALRESYIGPVILGFPNFMGNLVKWNLQVSPFGLAGMFSQREINNMKQGNYKAAWTAMAGVGTFVLATWIRYQALKEDEEGKGNDRGNYGGAQWWQLRTPGGKLIDARVTPFAFNLFLGDVVARKLLGLNTDHIKLKDTVDVLGMDARGFTQGADIAGELYNAFMNDQKGKDSAAKFTGSFVNRYLTPLRWSMDMLTDLAPELQKQRDVSGVKYGPFIDTVIGSTPGKIVLPEAVRPETADPDATRNLNPLSKQFSNLKIVDEGNYIENLFAKAGIMWTDWMQKIPGENNFNYDFKLEIRKGMELVNEVLEHQRDNGELKGKTVNMRAYEALEMTRAIVAAAKNRALEKYPDLKFQESINGQFSKWEKRVIEEQIKLQGGKSFKEWQDELKNTRGLFDKSPKMPDNEEDSTIDDILNRRQNDVIDGILERRGGQTPTTEPIEPNVEPTPETDIER